MSFYKKIPVLDEKEQAEFDKYLRETYQKDINLAMDITFRRPVGDPLFADEHSQNLALQVILDKLATPRIYLLQDWIHKRQQKAAGVED